MKLHRKSKWIIGIGAGIVLLVTIFALCINSILASILARRLSEGVHKGSNDHYRIEFEHLKVNVFNGSAEIDSVRLIADTNVKDNVFGGHVAAIRLHGLKVLHYLFSKKLDIDSVVAEDPAIFFDHKKIVNDTSKNKKTLYQELSGKLKEITIGRIAFRRTRLDYRDQTGKKLHDWHLKELDLAGQELLIDSATQHDTSRSFFCREVTAAIYHLHGKTYGGLYEYKLESAVFTTHDNDARFKGIRIQPLPRETFFKRSKMDRFDFELASIDVNHFNFRTFIGEQSFTAPRIIAKNGYLGVYGNPNGTIQKTDRVVTFPAYVLEHLPIRLKIDILQFSGLDVSYFEFNKGTEKTGHVSFDQTAGSFQNLGNLWQHTKEHAQCKGHLNSLFMGKGRLNLDVSFSLNEPSYAYHIKGKLGSFPADAVNPAAIPLAQVEVKKGTLRSMAFSIHANRHKSTGSLSLLYNDVSLKMLNNQEHTKLLPTLAVNAIVIKHNNPDQAGKPPRFAKIVFLRPKSYPFFQSLWQSLLTGIKACGGIGPAVQPKKSKSLDPKIAKAERKAAKKTLKAKKKADKEHAKQEQGKSN